MPPPRAKRRPPARRAGSTRLELSWPFFLSSLPVVFQPGFQRGVRGAQLEYLLKTLDRVFFLSHAVIKAAGGPPGRRILPVGTDEVVVEAERVPPPAGFFQLLAFREAVGHGDGNGGRMLPVQFLSWLAKVVAE